MLVSPHPPSNISDFQKVSGMIPEATYPMILRVGFLNSNGSKQTHQDRRLIQTDDNDTKSSRLSSGRFNILIKIILVHTDH